jgi:hypothetical protein
MNIRLLFILLFFSAGLTAQEYWNKEDFEIGNRGIENTWKEFSFNWQAPSSFNLPDGSFLHLKDEFQKDEIDMLAVIHKSNRNRVKMEVDLGSPLPQTKREKKVLQVTGSVKAREQDDIFINPYFYNPFLNNYNQRGLGTRRYTSPYNYNY